MKNLATVIVSLCLATSAHADPLPARDNAYTATANRWSMGVFNPLRYGVTDRLELSVKPLIFFVAPHLDARFRLTTFEGWQLTAAAGLSTPSLAMRLLQGYLFPSFEHDQGKIGWAIVPELGFLASRGRSDNNVLTVRADVATGIPIVAARNLHPLEAPQPIDLLFAPVLNGYRARLGALGDLRINDRWRWRLYGDVFFHGINSDSTRVGFSSHLTFRVGGGLDLAIGKMSRLVLGFVLWNSFQHAIDSAGNSIRSTDPLPVLDFIWAG